MFICAVLSPLPLLSAYVSHSRWTSANTHFVTMKQCITVWHAFCEVFLHTHPQTHWHTATHTFVSTCTQSKLLTHTTQLKSNASLSFLSHTHILSFLRIHFFVSHTHFLVYDTYHLSLSICLSLFLFLSLPFSLTHTHTSTSTCTCVHSRSQTLKQKSLFLIPKSRDNFSFSVLTRWYACFQCSTSFFNRSISALYSSGVILSPYKIS